MSLADIRVAADQWRADYATERTAACLPGEENWPGKGSWVLILASHIVQGPQAQADTAVLGGSFNPLVARQLMVGEQKVRTALTYEL